MGLTAQSRGELCCFVVGFIFSFSFEFMHAINVTNKPYFLVPHGMPVVSTIFPMGGDLGSKYVL